MTRTEPAVVEAIYAFDHPHDEDARHLTHLLGGKGAGLAEMTASLGLNVPPGFTIGLPVARAYRDGGWPPELDAALDDHVARLGTLMGRRFGNPTDPLLVAVRSGAPVSMPGMLDTVLNLGLTDESVQGLARVSGDERFAWETFHRFLYMYATTVRGLPAESLGEREPGADPDAIRAGVDALRARIAELGAAPVPQDPHQQLRETIRAVFDSWDSPRARAYRRKEGIDEDLGTAVNVQSMVFGNRGPSSGTGVVFTRDPSTGAPDVYGDYLPCAQGEDVVSGTARTQLISALAEQLPDTYAELTSVLGRLEEHYRDLCDVEFTIEEGRLWILQTRAGKRSPIAAVRVAADLVDHPRIRLSHNEALERVPADVRARARADVLGLAAQDGGQELLGSGLGASPGRVSGRVALSAEEALDAEGDVILVRRETSPEDVPGMAASVGILTTRGGLVSHAAVVARGWGIVAVVGADCLTVGDGEIRTADGTRVRAGDVITIDGSTGHVWLGEHLPAVVDDPEAAVREHLPQLELLERWATEDRATPAGSAER